MDRIRSGGPVVFRTILYGALLMCLVFLGGCSVQLYGGLSEEEANEMMALLLQHGIACEKEPGQEQTFTLLVDGKMVSTALEILRQDGYPKPKFQSMGEVFRREGMMSSPMEERVRFIYALSQEIAETLSHIDGVLAARVHIVLPENNPLQEKTAPSSASVFIKHRPSLDLALLTPRIKALVANSIEGLNYDRVTVVLMESQMAANYGGAPLASSAKFSLVFLVLVGGGCFVGGLLLAGGLFFVLRKNGWSQHRSDAARSH